MLNSQFSMVVRDGAYCSPRMRIENWELSIDQILPQPYPSHPHHFSAGHQSIAFIAPDNLPAREACAPDDKAHQVAQGIQPAELDRFAIAKDDAADCYRLNHPIHERPGKKTHAQQPAIV